MRRLLPFSYTFANYRIHEVSNWYTFNMNLAISSCAILVNRDSWAALSDSERAMIE